MTTELQRAKARALRLLSVRNRSEYELRERLQTSFEDDVIEQVVRWLRHLKYIDDHVFATEWVASRIRHKPSGPRKLAHELKQKGIDRAIIDTVLADIDSDTEVRLAREAVAKRVTRLDDIDSTAGRRKLYGFLARRGFSPAAARRALEQVKETWQSQG